MNASVLPDAVPVVTIRCSPRRAASQASRLVGVELVDPLPRERLAQLRVHVGRERRGPRFARAARSSRYASSSPWSRSSQRQDRRAPCRAILPDEHRPARVDAGEVGARRRDDGVERPGGRPREHAARALARAVAVRRVGLDDDDVEAREAERRRVDAREAELEHAAGRLAEQLEDLRRRARGERGREPHSVAEDGDRPAPERRRAERDERRGHERATRESRGRRLPDSEQPEEREDAHLPNGGLLA